MNGTFCLSLIGLFVAGRFFWSVQEKETVHSQGEMGNCLIAFTEAQ